MGDAKWQELKRLLIVSEKYLDIAKIGDTIFV